MMLTGIYSSEHYNSSRKPVVEIKLFPNSATNHSTTKHSFFAKPFCFVYFLLSISFLIVLSGFRLDIFLFDFSFFKASGLSLYFAPLGIVVVVL